jgi:hypothetical protein
MLQIANAPGTARTCDPLLRRQMLYPLSYGSSLFNDADVSMRLTFAVNRETRNGTRT